jgi:phage tail protein X
MLKKILTLSLSIGVASALFLGTALVANEKVNLPSSWTTTRVTYNITVEELAKKYYGDTKDYKLILEANKNILRGNHTVPKNTEIKIPITSKFRDQPEQLGWNSPS